MADIFDILVIATDTRGPIVVPETYTEIGNVSLPGAALGKYEYNMSAAIEYDQANLSEFLRFSIDGGSTWQEFITEPSDATNKAPRSYFFFRDGVSGDLSLILQARKENATGTFTVHAANASIRRVA